MIVHETTIYIKVKERTILQIILRPSIINRDPFYKRSHRSSNNIKNSLYDINKKKKSLITVCYITQILYCSQRKRKPEQKLSYIYALLLITNSVHRGLLFFTLYMYHYQLKVWIYTFFSFSIGKRTIDATKFPVNIIYWN